MKMRKIKFEELPDLLRLYSFLHPDDPKIDAGSTIVVALWSKIYQNDHLQYFVSEESGKIISTCTLTIIPNFTRGLRPYGLIENVVTDPIYRRKGYATSVLLYALSEACRAGCYKVMLETGRKDEDTLRFYEKAGFKRGVKTAFIAYPDK